MHRSGPRVLLVLIAALVAGAPAMGAGTASISAPAAVKPGGRILVVGRSRVTGGKAQLQTRKGRVWKRVATAPVRRGTFRLRTAAPKTGRNVDLRVLIERGRRTLARSPVARVAVLPASVSKGARVPLPADSIVSAPPAGAAGQIQVAGPVSAQPGDVVAAGVGPQTPTGLLDRVAAVSTQGSTTTVSVAPTTLLDALPQGGFTATIGSTGSRASRGVAQDIEKSVSCDAGGTMAVTGALSITSSFGLSAHWGGFSWSHPLGHLDSAAFTASLTAAAKLEAKVSGSAGCKLDKTSIGQTDLPVVTVDVLGLPVVLVPRIDWNIEAAAQVDAAIETDIHGSITASGGIEYRSGRFSPVSNFSAGMGFDPPTVTAKAHGEADLEPSFRVLLYGVAGPSLNLTAGLAFDAQPGASPWWTLTAPVRLTGSLDVPDLDLHSGEIGIYDHTFPVAQAQDSGPAAPGASVTPPASSSPDARHVQTWSQTDDLECGLVTEDDHDWFFNDDAGSDACGTFLVVDGVLYGPETIPAGDDLEGYEAWDPVSQTVSGTGSTSDPFVVTTRVAAGDTGVELTEKDVYAQGGSTVDSTFDVSGQPGDTESVGLYQAADCYVSDDDYGVGDFDTSSGGVACVHHGDDGTDHTMRLTPLTAGASSTEEGYSDVWSDIAAQGPFNGACACDEDIDNGFGLTWALDLDGSTPVEARSRLAVS